MTPLRGTQDWTRASTPSGSPPSTGGERQYGGFSVASLFYIRIFFRIWEEFLAIAHSPALGELSLDPEVWLKMCDVYP